MSTPPTSTPPTKTLGDHLIRVIKLIHSAKASVPWVHPDVDPFHHPLLFRIWAQPQRLSDLAVALHADVSTTSRQVTHLTNLGLVHKLPDPADRRANLLDLTDEGKSLLLDLQCDRDARLDRVLGHWSADDRAQFAAHLERFADDLAAALDDERLFAPLPPADPPATRPTDPQECA